MRQSVSTHAGRHSALSRPQVLRPILARRPCRVQASHNELFSLAADVAKKAAEKADAAVGSVNAPGWVLPVAALTAGVVISASSVLLKPGADAAEAIKQRDAKKWNSNK